MSRFVLQRWLLACSALVVGLTALETWALAAQPAQQGLSAGFTITDPESPEGAVVGKLFIDRSALRIEQTVEGEPAIVVFDFERNIMVWLDPAQKSYFELDASEADMGWLDWLFLVQDDPCGAAEGEDIKAKELGTVELLGRSTQKWDCRYADSEDGDLVWTVWNDPALSVPLRVEDSTGFIFAIDQLALGPQPAALFQVPEGYRSEAAIQD